MTQGPNVKKLIAHKISIDAIPSGGGFADGVKFLQNRERILSVARTATKWVAEAIQLVRTAGEPNPWSNADDEVIAEEILKGIDARRKSSA